MGNVGGWGIFGNTERTSVTYMTECLRISRKLGVSGYARKQILKSSLNLDFISFFVPLLVEACTNSLIAYSRANTKDSELSGMPRPSKSKSSINRLLSCEYKQNERDASPFEKQKQH